MIYLAITVLHVGAAAATLGIIGFTLFALYGSKKDVYAACALWLGSVAAFQVLSGTALALLSPEVSAASLALHIASYLSVCLVVELMLFVRMQKIALAFPLIRTASPVFMSASVFLLAITFGF